MSSVAVPVLKSIAMPVEVCPVVAFGSVSEVGENEATGAVDCAATPVVVIAVAIPASA